MPLQSLPGVVHLPSAFSAQATADRLESLVRENGLVVFARIDFARDASHVGLELTEMIQLVFGDPRNGTPILASTPEAGLALPLRALAWEDANGQSWLSYETPERTGEQYGIPEHLLERLAGLRAVCESAVRTSVPVAVDPHSHSQPRSGRLRPRLLSYALAAGGVALVGSGVLSPHGQGRAYAAPRQAMAVMHSAAGADSLGDPDRDFVVRMVPHHQGAIEMARVELRDGHNMRLRRLAQEIIITQAQEIAALRRGLEP